MPSESGGVQSPVTKFEYREIFPSSDPDILFEGYFDEIRKRVFRPRTDADAERIVDLELSAPPITPLSNIETTNLRSYLRGKAKNEVRSINETYPMFTEEVIYFADPKDMPSLDRPHFLNASESTHHDDAVRWIAALRAKGIQPLKLEELIKLLSNPEIIDSSRYITRNYSDAMSGAGSRFLYAKSAGERPFSDHYGYDSAADFKVKLDRVKARTKKSSLSLLDIGGNTGRAIRDAKNIDPSLFTFNMTLDSLPAVAGDIIVRRPAEYMPASFEERIDIIESNFAFKYFLYPDIALRNVVKALAVGGEANIGFTNDACGLEEEELLKRMKEIFGWLKKLKEEGYIDIAPQKDYDPLYPLEEDRAHFGTRLQITKLKSTLGL